MPALAPMRVVGPPPTAPPYGLVNTPGTLVAQSDPHWLAGVLVDSYPIDMPHTHDPCSSGTNRTKAEGVGPPHPEFGSFTVYIPITCTGLGLGNEGGAELMRNRAREAFAARESFGVEHELAFGSSDITRPHLTDPDLDKPNGNTATGPREALALLEAAIGATGQEGFIHLDPATFTAMAAFYLFEPAGATMRTQRGSTVIIGNGYLGARPDAGPALTGGDQNWAFATGPVRLSRDEVAVPSTADALNRDDNSITFRAERNYVAYWDTALQAGVLVDRSVTP